MTVCFIILGHQHPDHISAITRHLLDAKQSVVIHYDTKSSEEEYRYLVNKYTQVVNVHFTPRVSVEWGTWSLVRATLNALETIKAKQIQPDYVYLLSGNDYPIRPVNELIQYLDRNKGMEFIENWPADTVKWVASDKQRGRYLYRHPISSKKSTYIFSLFYQFQRLLGLKRPFVNGYTPYIGSQWWALTWDSCQKVLELARNDRKIKRFFKGVHVPDELFFQTLVNVVVPREKIANKKLTFSEFDDFGKAITFEFQHFEYVTAQPFYFARKISPSSRKLIDWLDDIVSGGKNSPSIEDREIGIQNNCFHKFHVKVHPVLIK